MNHQPQYSYPYTCIVKNFEGHAENGRSVVRSFRPVRERLQLAGYNIKSVEGCWRNNGEYRGSFKINCGDNVIDAFSLEAAFKHHNRGREKWDDVNFRRNNPGPYLWMATRADAGFLGTRHYEYLPVQEDLIFACYYDAERRRRFNGYDLVKQGLEDMYPPPPPPPPPQQQGPQGQGGYVTVYFVAEDEDAA